MSQSELYKMALRLRRNLLDVPHDSRSWYQNALVSSAAQEKQIMQFTRFKTAVLRQFELMSQYELYRTNVESEALWERYLSSFPAGSNPIFRQRSEHDCSCCRHFIRSIGNVVAIIDNRLVSLWDGATDDATYQVVSDAMADLVKSRPIDNVFLHTEHKVGTDKSYENTPSMVTTWDHFYVPIPRSNNRERNFICTKVEMGPKLSAAKADHDVLLRGLTELSQTAIDTTLELIAQNALYRGEEHQFAIREFASLKQVFASLPETQRDAFVWSRIKTVPTSVTRFRNTAIGTLLIDLSQGVELETAVRLFERMVAPVNYKRPTALVTQAMVTAAKAKIAELGLTSALERRYARLADITINNLLFADRQTRKALTGDVFDTIATKPIVKSFDHVETVPIETFIREILPQTTAMEVMFDPKHRNNLVSLIAPADPTAKNLFKWDNPFSWSYVGDVTDSIKERVKKAGGNVTGDLCCRLAWHNFDDLDFHMQEPNYEIYFANRSRVSPSGGRLDVDMNAGGGNTREPVENIFYASKAPMAEGVYHLYVQQYARRETSNVGFEVEIDFMGTQYSFVYDKPVTGNVTVARFRYSHAKGLEILDSLPQSSVSKQVWNLQTNDFHQVTAMMMSPNYWNEKGVGNKHYFLMIDGCKNAEQARGFFNEFLLEELSPHRRVIEIVGHKLKTDHADEQLSGLGFSSTQRTEILVKLRGGVNRTMKLAI